MMSTPELNTREWLLLSAYLDGELSPREKNQVEELLQANPASQQALEGLRRTCQVLQHAPARRVPRNFTLDESMLRRPWLPSFSRVLSYSSALAGLLLVIVLALDFSSSSRMLTASDLALAPQAESFSVAPSAKQAAEDAPLIINWGSPAPQMGIYGNGSGGRGEDMAYGLGGGEAAPAYGIGGGAPEIALMPEEGLVEPQILPEESAPEAFIPEESLGEMLDEPLEESLAIVPEPEAQAEEPALEEAPEVQLMAPGAAALGDSPILGVRPELEQGTVSFPGQPASRFDDELSAFPWRMLELILAALAGLGALSAWMLRKHQAR